jgi:hypothetical protein
VGARCISKSMGLFSCFFSHPPPRGIDRANYRLAAVADVDVLNCHFLLASRNRPYFIASKVLCAIRARARTCLLRASDSAEHAPFFRAFLLPSGAPPRAPCIRQTLCPRTAGARHCNPLRFESARHLGARCISKSMGLFSCFFVHPPPRGIDRANYRLAAVADVDVLNCHFLLALGSIFLQSRDLRRERPGELVRSALSCCGILSTWARRRANVMVALWTAAIWAASMVST